MSDQRLMQYLDLFARLGDDELAHLTGSPKPQVQALRAKVRQVEQAFAPWADLLERLDDGSLARLTGASVHAVAFWRRANGVKEPPVQPPLQGPGSRQAAAQGTNGTPRRGVPNRVTDVDTQPLSLEEDGRVRRPAHAPSSPAREALRGAGPRPSMGHGQDDDDDDVLITVEETERPATNASATSGDEEDMDWSDL